LFALLLKWQNWHVRLIIALPALIAPLFGWGFGSPRMRYVAPFAALLLLVALLPSLNSWQRPLFGAKSIFRTDPLALRCYYQAAKWPAEYREIVARIVPLNPRVVGFFTGVSSPDYPMQWLLMQELSPAPRFTAFNATLQIPGRLEPDPDVLLVARSNLKRLKHGSTGTWYAADRRIGRYTVFFKEPASPGGSQ
jgi:hypothetical protein